MKTRILFTMAICGICSVAMAQNTNTSLGDDALVSNTSGIRNVAVGNFTLGENTSGRGNSAFGYKALKNNTTGEFNTAVGGFSLTQANDSQNTAVGYKSQELATGHSNTSLGYRSYHQGIGNQNVAIGNNSMLEVTNGYSNTAVGYASYQSASGSHNTAIGNFTLTSANGSQNTAVGSYSQKSAKGYNNVSLGYQSLQNTTGGGNNVAIGNGAMYYANNISNNIAIGYKSLSGIKSGTQNNGLGTYVLENLTTGKDNVALGYGAGRALTTGTRNIFIGHEVRGVANSSYNIIMGYRSAAPTGDNNIVIGKKITLPAGTSNGLNIGGVLFGSGLQSALPNSSTAVPANGRIGINVVNPQAELDIQGKVLLRETESINGWAYNYFYWNAHSLVMGTPVGNWAHNSLDLKPGGCEQQPLHSQLRMYTATGVNQHDLKVSITSFGNAFFNNDGNFGIGTENPQYKLDVNGIIRAREVKIEVSGGADFVFEPSYKLRPLNELRTYVSENKHLPNIPSAAEMTDKGVDMGEFQVKLLQKIEELTLYIMEQDRRIKELENR